MMPTADETDELTVNQAAERVREAREKLRDARQQAAEAREKAEQAQADLEASHDADHAESTFSKKVRARDNARAKAEMAEKDVEKARAEVQSAERRLAAAMKDSPWREKQDAIHERVHDIEGKLAEGLMDLLEEAADEWADVMDLAREATEAERQREAAKFLLGENDLSGPDDVSDRTGLTYFEKQARTALSAALREDRDDVGPMLADIGRDDSGRAERRALRGLLEALGLAEPILRRLSRQQLDDEYAPNFQAAPEALEEAYEAAIPGDLRDHSALLETGEDDESN